MVKPVSFSNLLINCAAAEQCYMESSNYKIDFLEG